MAFLKGYFSGTACLSVPRSGQYEQPVPFYSGLNYPMDCASLQPVDSFTLHNNHVNH